MQAENHIPYGLHTPLHLHPYIPVRQIFHISRKPQRIRKILGLKPESHKLYFSLKDQFFPDHITIRFLFRLCAFLLFRYPELPTKLPKTAIFFLHFPPPSDTDRSQYKIPRSQP